MNIRRVYVYVVTAVTLNAVAWALIALLRNILTPGLHREQSVVVYSKEVMALQLAIIIIGLPIYLVHWLWAERLAQRDEEERQATLRGLYLYVMLTAFLTPFIANAYSFVQAALRLILGVERAIPTWRSELPSEDTLLFTLIAMLVLALLGGYHMWVIRTNRRTISDTATQDTIHRLYIYLFSFVGLVMTSVGVGNMLRWLLFRVGETAAVSTNEQSLIIALTELLVGIPVWLVFWWQAERMFNQGDNVEQASALRKFYLYLVIFLAALGTVGSLTTLLAGLFRRLLSLESQGDVRNVLSVLITTAVIWAYHFVVLRQDTKAMPEGQPQAGVRRLYWYLIAGIGLMALLVGIGGDISVFHPLFVWARRTVYEEFLARTTGLVYRHPHCRPGALVNSLAKHPGRMCWLRTGGGAGATVVGAKNLSLFLFAAGNPYLSRGRRLYFVTTGAAGNRRAHLPHTGIGHGSRYRLYVDGNRCLELPPHLIRRRHPARRQGCANSRHAISRKGAGGGGG
ncbi:MAG: hypothetical protein IPK53_09050 [bacterium]|nr:hypothetical protein [bacterium]